MAVLEEKKTAKRSDMPHNIVMENRQKLSISGVYDVESFDEAAIELYTSAGMLCIRGSELHINKLSIENGEVAVDGEVASMEYADGEYKRSGGFLSRLFR